MLQHSSQQLLLCLLAALDRLRGVIKLLILLKLFIVVAELAVRVLGTGRLRELGAPTEMAPIILFEL